MSLRLIIEDDEGSTTVVPLANEAVTIGRQQGNTIQLTEKNVSRRHARLVPEQDGWVIEDLGSYNGIKVNNEPIEGRTKLREGDVVEIGDYHLAITEDVDKSPLNFRTGGAANDGATAEPMLVSSSADLPRLSPEEIAALQSGRQAVTPPRMMADSGPIPAGQYHAGYGQPERKSNTGLFIFLGLAFLGLVILGVFFMMKDDGGGSGDVASSSGTKDGGEGKAVSPPQPQPRPLPADGGAAEAGAADAAEAADDAGAMADGAGADDAAAVADDGAGADDAAAVADDGSAADDAGVVDDGEEPVEVIEEPAPKPKRSKPRSETKPKPNVDADALLADARQLIFTNPAGAYKKAKASYQAKPNREPLLLMGAAACRLRDRNKVNYVLKRLKGADRTKIRDVCADKGFEL